ncbi:MAG: CvpA family protein [Candidatus Gygaella obscura]|nr:CvpA family protein [Candidatus Gygaella obscura]
MIKEIIYRLNWVDICIVVLFVRLIFIGAKTGFPTELLKLIGLVSGSIISFHYYVSFGAWVNAKVNMPKAPVEFVSYIVILVVSLFSFVLIRNLILRLVHIEAVSTVNRWGGLLLSILRAVFLCSAIIIGMLIIDNDYLKRSIDTSFFSNKIAMSGPNTYRFTWNIVLSKFSSSKELNKQLFDLTKGEK